MAISTKIAPPLALSFLVALGACKQENLPPAAEDTLSFSCDMPDLSSLKLTDRLDHIMPANIFIRTSNLSEEERNAETNPDEPAIPEANALGSGFIIDKRGYILTNNHVIDAAKEIHVSLFDRNAIEHVGIEIPAKLVGIDKDLDLAVLKLDVDYNLLCVKLGDSESLREGFDAVAIGNPLGKPFTVSKGIISHTDAEIDNPLYNYIGTDAAVNRGNSGGGLYNDAAEVIGMNTMILSPNGGNIGLAYSSKSNDLREAANEIIQFGAVQRGALGARLELVSDEIAQKYGLEDLVGVVVSEVVSGKAAEKAGVLAGDILLSVNGEDIRSRRAAQQATRMIASKNPGDVIDLEVMRDGQILHLYPELMDRSVVVSVPEMQQPPKPMDAPPPPPSLDIPQLNIPGPE